MHVMQTTPGASLSGRQPDDRGYPDRQPEGLVSAPARGRRRPQMHALLLVAGIVLGLDLTSKIVAVRTLSNRTSVDLLGGFLTLRLTRNAGAAFSIGVGMTVVFTAVAVIVIFAILRTARRLYSLPWAIALGGLLGGALGNLTDRIFRSPGVFRGHVVDFIELPNWPVFNLADSAIVGAGILMFILAARGIPIEGRQPPAPAEQGGSAQTAAHAGPDQ
jgi:lipoprotein signal peptidase